MSRLVVLLSLLAAIWAAVATGSEITPAELGIRFIDGSSSKLIVEKNGRECTLDLLKKSIAETRAEQPERVAQHQSPSDSPKGNSDGAGIFKDKCATCHGADGKGVSRVGTPDFTDPKTLANVSEEQVIKIIKDGKGGMPAWSGKLSDSEIQTVASYVRGFASHGNSSGQIQAADGPSATGTEYQSGDDLLVTLPTGRPLDRHGAYVNFTHRFAYDPAFTGPARGGDLLGLDGFDSPPADSDAVSQRIRRSVSIVHRRSRQADPNHDGLLHLG